MAFSHIKIKAAKHGSKTETWLNGAIPPGVISVKLESEVGSATVATIKMFCTAEVEGDVLDKSIVLCPKCREEQVPGKLIAVDCTEMGDENRKYIAT
jgi:hypothetical protein